MIYLNRLFIFTFIPTRIVCCNMICLHMSPWNMNKKSRNVLLNMSSLRGSVFQEFWQSSLFMVFVLRSSFCFSSQYRCYTTAAAAAAAYSGRASWVILSPYPTRTNVLPNSATTGSAAAVTTATDFSTAYLDCSDSAAAYLKCSDSAATCSTQAI